MTTEITTRFHHTESRTFDIAEESIRDQFGLSADWYLSYAKSDLAPRKAGSEPYSPLQRVVQVRFERRIS